MNQAVTNDRYILAVDIGGTKLAAAVITSGGMIRSRIVEPTLQEGPRQGIAQIIRLLQSVMRSADITPADCIGIGIGIPAVLEPETDLVIWGPNLKDWRNVDLRTPLEQYFHLPVCVEYDGHTAVLGEWWRGAGQGFRNVVSVIIGTGVGGGMVVDGRLIRGVNRLAGAVGWFTMQPEDASQDEAERALGSWEARIAGPGIARIARQALENRPPVGTNLVIDGEHPTAEDVFIEAQKGDVLAEKIASQQAELLGMGLANIVSLVNPEIIILGGSVGTHSGFMLTQVISVIDLHAQPISSRSVQVVTSSLGSDAGLLGAAYGLILRVNQPEST